MPSNPPALLRTGLYNSQEHLGKAQEVELIQANLEPSKLNEPSRANSCARFVIHLHIVKGNSNWCMSGFLALTAPEGIWEGEGIGQTCHLAEKYLLLLISIKHQQTGLRVLQEEVIFQSNAYALLTHITVLGYRREKIYRVLKASILNDTWKSQFSIHRADHRMIMANNIFFVVVNQLHLIRQC